MSYCRKEGKDIIIFSTKEDQSTPSTAVLLEEKDSDYDKGHEGAILPNGEINFECPCLGSLPHGPCGPGFREAFTCWVENKDDQEAFGEHCYEKFTTWESCLNDHRHIYKSKDDDDEEKSKKEENKDESDRKIEMVEIDRTNENKIDTSKPAIAAASAI